MNFKRKASPSSSEGGRVVKLNDDVLTEILARLPVKPVTKFKLVCKSWLSLISTHQFRILHTKRRLREPQPLVLVTRYWPSQLITKEKAALLLFNPSDEKIRTIPLPIVDLNNSEILSVSNGLMLLRFQHDRDGYYVHNPSTKQSKKLGLAYHEEYTHIVSIHIVFDPSKSLHYKIVCVRAKDKSYFIEVLASERRRWRVHVEPFVSRESMTFSDCVQCNNSVYLIHNKPRNSSIYGFDIVKSVSELIVFPEPSGRRKGASSHVLQGSNGHLYYCALVAGSYGYTPALWELKVNGGDLRGSKWRLKYDHRARRFPFEVKLLSFIVKTSTILIHVPEKIVAYNFVDESYKEILDLDAQACAKEFQYGKVEANANVYEFNETLALL